MIRLGHRTLSVLLLTAASAFIIGATPALADCGISTVHFCAYRHAGYGDQMLHSGAGLNSEVDIEDNQVSSGKNGTNNYWWGMNEHTFLPDECVFYWSPNTEASYVGSNANDKIDHFAVKSGNC